MEQFIHQYITLTKQKQQRQKNISWLNFWDPQHRLEWLINEVQEVSDELKPNNQIYLQDELWDIFWNYMNFLTLLEDKWYISDTKTILQQSYNKFHERTSAVIDKTDKSSSDLARDEVKKTQKKRLKQQHNELYK
jgi:NTP pyrophosphatase (non-canonical NTP hydrolase)